MTPQTLKMLVMFILAAALLNVTNYIFCWFYESPSHKAIKVTETKPLKTRGFHPKHHATKTIIWTALISCEEKSRNISTKNRTQPSSTTIISSSEEIQVDYREMMSTETNSFYYYNGIRRGPVMCPEVPPGLGPVKVNSLSLDEIDNMHNKLQQGGIYEELECAPRQTVAIIVAHRVDYSGLRHFLYSIHPIMIKQQLEYQVFVINQWNISTPFHLGKLFNVGFIEAQRMKKNGGWRCIIFHDPNLVPMDSRNLYRCDKQPLQLVATMENSTASMKYEYGGVVAIKPKHFKKVDGFSNLNLTDDQMYYDLYQRVQLNNLTVTRRNETIGKFTRLSSKEDKSASGLPPVPTYPPSYVSLLDGLATISYTLTNIELKPLFTQVEVDLESGGPPPTDNLGPPKNDGKLLDKLLNQQATSSSKLSKTHSN